MRRDFSQVRITAVILFILAFNSSQGQSAAGIYGILRDGNNFFASKADPASGNIVNFQPLVLTPGGMGNNSALTNANGGLFYFSNGKEIVTFDINNGTFTDSSAIFPLTTSEKLVEIRYNPCDSGLYGILNNSSPPYSYYLARVDPLTGFVTTINPQSVNGFGNSGTVIDHNQGVYYFLNGPNLIGVSIATGLVISNVATLPPPGESFRHLAYDCFNSTLYGLSANSTTFEKYLATVDPLTGIVTHVSNTNNLNNYFWKLAFSEPTIDPASQSLFYIAAGYILVGVDILSGSANNVQTLQLTGTQSFQLPAYYPQCYCNGSLGMSENNNYEAPLLFPNPTSSTAKIKLNKPGVITIVSLTGVKLFEKIIPETQSHEIITIDFSFLSTGVYFLRYDNKTYRLVKN